MGKLLSVRVNDNTIKVWHLMTGELLRTLVGHTGYFNSIAISPDGKTIVSGSNNTINVWNLVTGELDLLQK
jgi:WD40 repeat protein